MKPLPRLESDGLLTPEVGAWAETKYELVSNYARIFSTSMKAKWECRVYLDLFAGAGRAQIEGTPSILPASPMLALDVPDRFDRYIFCEEDREKLEALRTRVEREHPTFDAHFLPGDANQLVDEILSKIPQARAGYRVLTFCFVDPFKLRNLHFVTIQGLAARFVDFLVLVPSAMDAHRNQKYYIDPASSVLDNFLGTREWREAWKSYPRQDRFGDFVTDQFGHQMSKLGYHYGGLESAVLNRSTGKNLPLYDLVFFSRSQKGMGFWDETRKYSDPQDLPL